MGPFWVSEVSEVRLRLPNLNLTHTKKIFFLCCYGHQDVAMVTSRDQKFLAMCCSGLGLGPSLSVPPEGRCIPCGKKYVPCGENYVPCG